MHLSYQERLAVIDHEPLELRSLKADLVLHHQCLHNVSALPSDTYFSTHALKHVYNTRSDGNRLNKPRCSTSAFKFSFFFQSLSPLSE